MKRFTLIVCFILLALLLIAAVPVTATTTTSTTTVNGDSITSIYPKVGYADGNTVTYTIKGVNFTTVEGDVWLERSGESNIEASSITTWSGSSNTIVCKFKITSAKEKGAWNLVIRKTYGSDVDYIVKSGAFTIVTPITLTSISPSTGSSGDDDVDFTLVGTGFENDENEIEDVYLFNEDYDDNATADFDIDSSTKIKGSFDLEDVEDDKYDVCVEDSFETVFCDLTYTVNTLEYGSLDISSSPSGAAIYIDGIANGTTPNTVDDVVAGSHKITLKKSGYQDWGKIVSVTEDDTTEVDATLYAVATATPVQTTNPTAAATSRPTTARTTAKSTIKVPTTWADTPAPTTASPVDPVLIIGTAGLAFIALRKH
jgi:hypothetical protein